VDCLPVAFADNLLKVIVIWKIIFNVWASQEVKSPSIPLCSILQFFVTGFDCQRCLLNWRLPVNEDVSFEVHFVHGF
jgi:hypothetical protein